MLSHPRTRHSVYPSPCWTASLSKNYYVSFVNAKTVFGAHYQQLARAALCQVYPTLAAEIQAHITFDFIYCNRARGAGKYSLKILTFLICDNFIIGDGYGAICCIRLGLRLSEEGRLGIRILV